MDPIHTHACIYISTSLYMTNPYSSPPLSAPLLVCLFLLLSCAVVVFLSSWSCCPCWAARLVGSLSSLSLSSVSCCLLGLLLFSLTAALPQVGFRIQRSFLSPCCSLLCRVSGFPAVVSCCLAVPLLCWPFPLASLMVAPFRVVGCCFLSVSLSLSLLSLVSAWGRSITPYGPMDLWM